MKEQNYQNHVRYYSLYHFIGLPLCIIILIGSIVYFIREILHHGSVLFSIFTLILTVLFIVTNISARFYGLTVQNRVIRMEENFRYYRLTGKLLDSTLSLPQIFALRFASDEEFVALCERAVLENLSPKDIKRAVKNWRADYLRV